MLKHKKILLIAIFSLITLFFVKSTVFAGVTTNAGEYHDFPSEFNDTTHDIVLINHKAGSVNDHFTAAPKDKGYFFVEDSIVKFKNTSGSTILLYVGEYNKGWTVSSENLNNGSIYSWSEMLVQSSEIGNFDTDRKSHIIFNNVNVYNGIDGKTNNSIFFHLPPQGILAPIVVGVKTEKTLQEIIQILPLILVVVVSLVGLRKGLAILSRLLHHA